MVIPPKYPEITQAQWEVLRALTDQRCTNLLASADFISDLDDAAKEFLRTADKEKIKELNDMIRFVQSVAVVGKFAWWGSASCLAIFLGITQLWDTISKYIKVTPR